MNDNNIQNISFEKAIIVGVNTDTNDTNFNEEILELKSLCYACNIEILDTITQNLNFVNTNTYVGKGKLEEIKIAINNLDIEAVVFNDELSPAQISALEKILDVAIYDRTFVILEIFKRRAKTKEAMIQVEIASLKYLLPRLMGLRKGLSRQRGTGGGFAHGRGAGETKLELDRRITGDKIVELKHELDDLVRLRKQQRVLREKNDIKTIALVGYTNSGKSSTLNALLNYSKGLKKEVFEKNMLFATLETSTRQIVFDNNQKILITDTVGFISKLPHHLVEAFKSTLEEINEADLIIHVVDSSNQNFEKQIETTNSVLHDIGVENIPMLYAFNKIDLHDDYFFIPKEYSNAIRISAKQDKNIKELLDIIIEKVFVDYQEVTIEIPFEKYKFLNLILTNSISTKKNETDTSTIITGKVSSKILKTLIDNNIKVTSNN